MRPEEQDQWGADQDLMGVHGDVLFADPLGVRNAKKGGRSSGRQDAPEHRNGGPRHPLAAGMEADNEGDALLCQEEEEPSWVRSVFSYVLNTGTQCCSMRDRNKDAEAAKKAAAEGRPPETTFPPPRRGSDASGHQEPETPLAARQAPFARGPSDSDEDSDVETTAPGRPPPGNLMPHPDPVGAPASRGLDFEGNRRKPDKRTAAPAIPGLTAPEEPSSAMQSSLQAGRRVYSPPRSPSPEPQQRHAAPERPPVPPQIAALDTSGGDVMASRGKSAMPGQWKWPAWCLNFKTPCIEVYVNDEEDGTWKWCEAEPQSRVVNKAGHDAYLCAEYNWDGEYYVQDFGPEHVRRRGASVSVAELYMKNSDEDASSQRNRADTGGGVASFLDDD